jgi:hypothetical protein
MQNTKLIEQIRGAFPTQPIRADEAFAQWGKSYPDARPYTEQVDGKSWDQLDRAYMIRRSDALGFLSTRALVAVLPVYLSALVEDGVWSPAAGMLTLILAKPPTKKVADTARFNELVGALTDQQRSVVAAVLRAFAESDEEGSLGQAARAAFDEHWSTYVPAGA